MSNRPPNSDGWDPFAAENHEHRVPVSGQRGRRVWLPTDAIQTDAQLSLFEGYQVAPCECGDKHCQALEMWMAVTRENILNLMSQLLERMGEPITPVFYEHTPDNREIAYMGDTFDTNILLSYLDPYEHVLLNDGNTMLTFQNEAQDAILKILPFRLLVLETLPERVDEFRTILESSGIDEQHPMDTVLQHNFELASNSVLQDRFREMLATLNMEEIADDL